MPTTSNRRILISDLVRRQERGDELAADDLAGCQHGIDDVRGAREHGSPPGHREAGDLACLVVEKNMYKSEVRSAVLARLQPSLQPRTMTNLSQSTMAQLTCFPYKAAHDLFPSNLRGSPNEMENILLWEADSVKQSQQLFSDLLESSKSTGLTKVLKTESEKVSRRVVHIVPPSSVSLELSPTGSSRLIINILFCVMTEDGLICWPKDTSGREIEFSAEEENEIRRAIKTDVLVMIAKGTVPMADGTVPMADGWYDMVEMPRPERPTKKQKVSTPKEPPEERFNVESILEERPSTGRAVRWFRVRWAGYSAAWEQWRRWGEVGSPIETWEPLVNVRNTEAMEAWRSGAWHSPRCAS